MKAKISLKRGDCGCNVIPIKQNGRVNLKISDLLPLYGDELGDFFLLVTSPRIRSALNLVGKDDRVIEYSWDGPMRRRGLINKFREFQQKELRGSALWIADDEFQHFLPSQLQGIKLAGVSYFSDTFSAESLAQYIEIITAKNYEEQSLIEGKFLACLENSERIVFCTKKHGATATFNHHTAEYWFSMHGALDYGQQIVLPTGELATLAEASGEFHFHSRFDINGEIILQGMPVVHRGNHDLTYEDTEKQFRSIFSMRDFPVRCTVKDGLIINTKSAVPGENPFLKELRRIFELDERYQKIHEVGFGTNSICSILENRNFFANERYPGVHFGLGLGGTTSYHLDLVCTDTKVFVEMKNRKLIDVYEKLGLTRDLK